MYLTSFHFFWQLFRSNWSIIWGTGRFQTFRRIRNRLHFLQKQRFYRFQTFFKDSLCLQRLTNLDAKDAKRSVKMWATYFYKSFFHKYFAVYEWSAVKNSLSTYICYTPDGLFWMNLYVKRDHFEVNLRNIFTYYLNKASFGTSWLSLIWSIIPLAAQWLWLLTHLDSKRNKRSGTW